MDVVGRADTEWREGRLSMDKKIQAGVKMTLTVSMKGSRLKVVL
jgi:hypothetical protein